MPDYKTAEMKMPGEKLVRVYVDDRGGIINDIRITGDFFIHPEEGIDMIESSLRGIPVESGAMERALSGAVTDNGLQLVGVSTGTIAAAILGAAGG